MAGGSGVVEGDQEGNIKGRFIFKGLNCDLRGTIRFRAGGEGEDFRVRDSDRGLILSGRRAPGVSARSHALGI